MTFSGDGEFNLASTVKHFQFEETSYFVTMTSIFNKSGSTALLLHIILVVCMVTLLLFLCIAMCYCKQVCHRKSKRKSRVIKAKTVLISKSTSITGLNGNYNQCNNEKLKEEEFMHNMQVQLKDYKSPSCKNENNPTEPNAKAPAFNNRSYLQMKLVTSTPTGKNAAMLPSGVSGVMIFSPQSTIAGSHWQSAHQDITMTQNCGLQYSTPCVSKQTRYTNFAKSPGSGQALDLEKDVVYSKSRDSISSACLYGTAASQLLETNTNTVSPKQDDSAGYADDKDLLSEDSVMPELSPLSPEGVASSLPLDANGHPRAWFVPLDEIYHEPLRHSFIDVSNSTQDHEFLVPQMKRHAKVQGTPNSKNISATVNSVHSSNSNSTGDSLYEKNEDGSIRWRDSGVPSSQIITKSSSSDLEGKKIPSAWDQREGRPVILSKRE